MLRAIFISEFPLASKGTRGRKRRNKLWTGIKFVFRSPNRIGAVLFQKCMSSRGEWPYFLYLTTDLLFVSSWHEVDRSFPIDVIIGELLVQIGEY